VIALASVTLPWPALVGLFVLGVLVSAPFFLHWHGVIADEQQQREDELDRRQRLMCEAEAVLSAKQIRLGFQHPEGRP
jgi:hypothetical protein